jgi:hypothetical protein
MFTIGFGDSNRFLPHRARQPVGPSGTPAAATFVQQFCCNRRICGFQPRHLRNTDENAESRPGVSRKHTQVLAAQRGTPALN